MVRQTRSFLNLCLFITQQDVIGLQTAPSGTKLQDELSITSHLAYIIHRNIWLIAIHICFSAVSSISNYLQWDVDVHVYLCYQNNQQGVAGTAWGRSTCSTHQYYRSTINEWLENDLNTARVSKRLQFWAVRCGKIHVTRNNLGLIVIIMYFRL